MPKGGISIGRVFGIPIRLNYSWFIIFIVVTWALSAGYFHYTYPGWSLAARVAAGVLTSLLFFGSVLAHELMHSIVAQRAGIPVRSITLFIFGGVSELAEEPKRPGDELRMTLAGPLTSLVLGGICWAIWFGVRNTTSFVTGIAFWLGWINVSLAVFNIIPGFPLDGGRVLRALIWRHTNNLRRATRIAAGIGRIVGYLLVFAGVWLVFQGNWVNGVLLAFMGWFLENAAVGSYRQVALTHTLKGHKVSEVMTRECSMVRPELSIEELVHGYVLNTGRRCFPVTAENRVLGLVTIHNVKAVPRQEWQVRTVKDIMTPLEKLKWVGPEQDLSTVLEMMTESDINQVPVMENGQIVGMIARDNLLNYVAVRGELGM